MGPDWWQATRLPYFNWSGLTCSTVYGSSTSVYTDPSFPSQTPIVTYLVVTVPSGIVNAVVQTT